MLLKAKTVYFVFKSVRGFGEDFAFTLKPLLCFNSVRGLGEDFA